MCFSWAPACNDTIIIIYVIKHALHFSECLRTELYVITVKDLSE